MFMQDRDGSYLRGFPTKLHQRVSLRKTLRARGEGKNKDTAELAKSRYVQYSPGEADQRRIVGNTKSTLDPYKQPSLSWLLHYCQLSPLRILLVFGKKRSRSSQMRAGQRGQRKKQ